MSCFDNADPAGARDRKARPGHFVRARVLAEAGVEASGTAIFLKARALRSSRW